ncbi:MAG: hypothetical protein IPL26_30225 [Leptospiraceae bacterium]|nr:hypothetical protein [Leptospiraceae bacterium]
MTNAEIAKKLADKNCLVCASGEKNGKYVICKNVNSLLNNRMTSGYVVCDEFKPEVETDGSEKE